MGSLFSFLSVAYYIPRLYFATSTISVAARRSAKSKEVQRIPFREFVEAKCPSLYKQFRPAWWLFSGHLQTLYCVLGDFSKIDKVEYDRILLQTIDGGTIGLDVTPSKNGRTLPDDTPVVVVLHGLTGGSHESYVRSILSPACAPVEQGGLGFRGIVVNFRGCAGVPLTSPQLYSAGFTDDIRVALMYISKTYPQAPLLGVGFSLGANVLTRYLAQEGKQSRLAAGCVLGCPWNLTANSDRLESGPILRVYSRGMAQNLSRVMARHAEALEKFPESELTKAALDLRVMKNPSLRDFDNAITRLAGGSSPPFPFETAHHYYAWGSSHELLCDVRVPFLALNADDDPIVRVLPIESGPDSLGQYVVFGVTRGGGHLGWFERGSSWGHLRRWVSKPVVEWLKATGEDLVQPAEPRGRKLVEVDGFLMEEGGTNIGCKVVEGGGHIVGVEGEEGLLAGL